MKSSRINPYLANNFHIQYFLATTILPMVERHIQKILKSCTEIYNSFLEYMQLHIVFQLLSDILLLFRRDFLFLLLL